MLGGLRTGGFGEQLSDISHQIYSLRCIFSQVTKGGAEASEA